MAIRHCYFRIRWTLSGVMASHALLLAGEAAEKERAATEPVSYYQQVRPVLQTACHGCHQPAKAKGGYVMTSREALFKGGEDGVAIVPGKLEEGSLLQRISLPAGHEDLMPPKDGPLAAPVRALIERWIAEGAVDDTPSNATARHSPENPPKYHRAPVVNSLDFSPDGKLLAVSGFHEVLLHSADGSELQGRLIGLSHRITSVRFSPDGAQLAVTGGLPGRMGELQVWDVASQKLKLSVPVTADTIYGADWSPDGKLVSFGCADTKAVRAVEAASGKEVLMMASHEDWVFDTVFSTKGDHIISVGRDMSTRLTEVATQRFVDNLTSITPGALKGGLAAVARHPSQDIVLVGGADGVPQVYRTQRLVERKIGDNSNLIRKYPPLPGRIFAVDYAASGKRIAAASSLHGKGHLGVYAAEFDTELPDEIKTIYAKTVTERSTEENAKVEAHVTDGARSLFTREFPAGLYTVRFSPDGHVVAAAGQDGSVHILNAETGEAIQCFCPVPIH